MLSEVDHSTPIDELEPEQDDSDAYREASRRFAKLFDQAMWHLPASLEMWQIAFAIGSSRTCGKSMEAIAKEYGFTRAAISKGVKAFQRSNNIRPIRGTQKDEDACRKYQQIRLSQLPDPS